MVHEATTGPQVTHPSFRPAEEKPMDRFHTGNLETLRGTSKATMGPMSQVQRTVVINHYDCHHRPLLTHYQPLVLPVSTTVQNHFLTMVNHD